MTDMNTTKTLISKSIVTRYANMKSILGDKAKDSEVKKAIMPIVTEFFPNNLDVKYKDLVKKFGEDVTNYAFVVLFGAWFDGRLERYYKPIDRLYRERNRYFKTK